MFDVIFVTYKSMMTVSTQRLGTPPRYATTPVLLCVRAVCFSKNMIMMTMWQNLSHSWYGGPTLWMQLSWCLHNFTILRWCLHLDGSSHRCPKARVRVVIVSSVHVWSRTLSFQWVGLWSAVKEVVECFSRMRIAKEYLVSYVWRAMLGGN